MKRICLQCQIEKFEKEIENNPRRINYYKIIIRSIRERVRRYKRTDSVQGCTEEHRIKLLEIRKEEKVILKKELEVLKKKVDNAQKNFDSAELINAEMILTGRDNKRTEIMLEHYRKSLSQRIRRLREAEEKRKINRRYQVQ